jgi:acyl dehydratase
MSYGRWFEEFEVGAVYKHWPGRTITEHDVSSYALLTMNLNPLFIDDHYARSVGETRRPVIDSLIFSLLVGISVADTSGRTIANLGFDFVKFEAPMYAGESLYGESEVLDVRESATKKDRGVVHIETRGFNERGEKVIVLRRKFLAPKRPSV